VIEVVVGTPAQLVVGVVVTKRLSACPGCGRSCRRVHDRRRRQIRDLEVSGRRTVLLWTQRRVRVRPVRQTAHGNPCPVYGWYDSSPGAPAGPGHPDRCPSRPMSIQTDVHPGRCPSRRCPASIGSFQVFPEKHVHHPLQGGYPLGGC